MKYTTPLLALLTFIIVMVSMPLQAERREKTGIVARTSNFGAGLGSLGISLTQFGTACTIGYYACINIKKELDQGERCNKSLCWIVSLIGLVSSPTLAYAAWKTGQFSVQSFNKAFVRVKKAEPPVQENKTPQASAIN